MARSPRPGVNGGNRLEKMILITFVVVVSSFLIWNILEFREEGAFSSYAAPPESPAPPQAAGSSFTYDFDSNREPCQSSFTVRAPDNDPRANGK
jgi:hypothetical protein